MPRRARRWTGIASSMLPSKCTDPLRARRMPMIERISVVLPAPLRPIRPVNLPAGNSMFTLRRMLIEPIETSRPSIRSTRHLPAAGWMQLLADHIAAHLRVLQHLLRLAVGDDAALVKSQNAMRVSAHDLHVVL